MSAKRQRGRTRASTSSCRSVRGESTCTPAPRPTLARSWNASCATTSLLSLCPSPPPRRTPSLPLPPTLTPSPPPRPSRPPARSVLDGGTPHAAAASPPPARQQHPRAVAHVARATPHVAVVVVLVVLAAAVPRTRFSREPPRTRSRAASRRRPRPPRRRRPARTLRSWRLSVPKCGRSKEPSAKSRRNWRRPPGRAGWSWRTLLSVAPPARRRPPPPPRRTHIHTRTHTHTATCPPAAPLTRQPPRARGRPPAPLPSPLSSSCAICK